VAAGGLLGGISGLGAYAAESGKAAREKMLLELQGQQSAADRAFRSGEGDKDRGFRREMQDDDQGFRSGESEKDRTFRSGESAADRGFRSTEVDKERTARQGLLSNSERFTDSTGKEWVRGADGVARPLKDEAGGQISGEDKLAVKRRDQARAYADSIIGKGDAMADPAQRQKAWDKAYSDYMTNPERKPGAAASEADPQLPPATPKDRKAGMVYKNANGVKAEWTGTGWRKVD
jgi:hypothetical protein